MIEQDTIARIHPICLSVVHGDPERIQLGDTIGAAGIERCSLALRCLDDLSVQFGCGGLVEADVLFEAAGTDGVEETEGAEAVDVSSVFGHFERDLDVGLGTKVVDLGGLDGGDNVDEVGAV